MAGNGEYVSADAPPFDAEAAAAYAAAVEAAKARRAAYSAAPASAPAMSVAAGSTPPPAGPPPPPATPPAPGKPSALGEFGRSVAIGAAGALLPGAPTVVGGLVNASRHMKSEGPKKEEAPPENTEPFGPPAPPVAGDDAPIILNPQGGGPARMVSPAGMYPHSNVVQTHEGRPVPEEAKRDFGLATAAQLHGADLQHEADRDYQANLRNVAEMKLRANEDARTSQARLQAKRDATVGRRLAEIEALNAEASAAVDSNKYFHDRGAFAGIFGALAIAAGEYGSKINGGPNTAMQIIENGINREIQAQLSNRQLAGQKVGRAERLLDLHLQRLGDKGKAIEATRLGLWDNAAIMADQYAAENKGRVSEANMLALKGAILERRGKVVNDLGLQEADDVQRSQTEQWHNAQYAGGGVGGAKFDDPKHVLTIPASDGTGEKTTHVAVDEKVYKELSELQGGVNALVDLNKMALQTRKELREASSPEAIKKDPLAAAERVATLRKRLVGYNNDRAVMAEKAKDPNSAVRDPEFQRAMASGVDYTAGAFGRNTVISGDTEKAIQNNSNVAQRIADAKIRGATGRIVKPAISRDAQGRVVNQWLPTGDYFEGRAIAPEKK